MPAGNLSNGVVATLLITARSALGRRSLTGADVFILLILLASTIVGLLRGFVREAVSLVFWLVAIWAAWKFGARIEPHLGGLLADPSVAPWVGRLIVMALILGVGLLVGMFLSYFTGRVGLGPLDRILGLLFGIVRGMLLVGLLIIGAELLQLNREPWWDHSKLVPYGESVGDWLRAMVGERGEPWAKLERLTGVKVK
jgi:membrane protein required for colicin V production